MLTGSGKRVVAATASGRLIGIDVTTGVIQERISKTPVYYTAASLAPGSAYAIHGSSMLAQASVAAPFPLPTELGASAFSSTTSQCRSSASRRTPSGTRCRSSSPCQSPPLSISRTNPYSLRGVSRDSPAQPREIVHAWAVGLGAVLPQPETGVPTAGNRSYPLAEPLECEVRSPPSPAVNAEVLFAGLAPGMIGIYQIDIRMPNSFASRFQYLSCGGDAGSFYAPAQ